MLGVLNEKEIEDVLVRNVTGRIGCTDGQRIYVVPVSYAYNNKYVIAHSKEGMKIDMMRKYSQVCFEVDEMQDLANWRSVIGWGQYEELVDEKERYYAMKFLISRLLHLQVSETARLPHLHEGDGGDHHEPPVHRPVVYRIRLDERTGRFEKHDQ